MKSFSNIERLPGKTYYTGYSAVGIWRISGRTGGWFAYRVNCPIDATHKNFTAGTMTAVSEKLASF